MKPALERHLFVSDFQIPEQDPKAIDAVLSFIPDFKPDYIHFVGDILDLTSLSTFDKNVYDKHSFMDEVTIGRQILKQFADTGRKSNRSVKLLFYSGNHSERLERYLGRKAQEIADIENDGELILSLPHLLEFKKLGIEHVPYFKEYAIKNRYLVEHGDIARAHGSYTAKAMLEKRGASGFSGHTHRLGIHYKTFSNTVKFWVETGCLCKINFRFPYRRANDWQNGFAIGIYNNETRLMYPYVVPILDGQFYWNGKFYK